MHDFESLFKKLAALKVAIVGDVMLDTYWWGNVDRISPEAPVPIVTLKTKDYRIGGAGNVALNCGAFNTGTTLFSVVGNDLEGDQLIHLLQHGNIDTSYISRSEGRVTTSKTRIMSRNQQMMRLDSEMASDILGLEEDNLLQNFLSYIEKEKPAVVILEDYNKGVLTERVIREVISICNQKGIITTVDPKRKNFFSYKGVSIFKPNLKEIKDALNKVSIDVNEAGLKDVHSELFQTLQHNISLITLSEHGIFYNDDKTSSIIPTHVRNIADVSGAGDTVIAVASLIYAATKDIHLASQVANIAGGLVCEEVGTVPINKGNLQAECKRLVR